MIVLVHNTRSNDLKLAGGLNLIPGENRVDAALWKKSRLNRHTMDLLGNQVIRVEGVLHDEPAAPKTTPKPPKSKRGRKPKDEPEETLDEQF